MIERQNWLDVQKWLAYQREVRQLSEKTVVKYRGSIRHLLEWADAVPFPRAHIIRPVYPAYLRDIPVIRNYRSMDKTLSKTTQELACMLARNFFTWSRRTLPNYQSVDPVWVDTLRPKRVAGTVTKREIYTLDEVIGLTQPREIDGLKEKRDKAAIALLFLSGMRVGALVTLPIMALNLEDLTVKQWPELDVATKGRKAATTYLLNIPELLSIAKTWDNVVRPALPRDAVWYARLAYNPMTGEITLSEDTSPDERRRGTIRYALLYLCAAAGIDYKSPHKLRHGHAVYALKRARTVAEYKAVSQNLMHTSLATTDTIYGILAESDVQSLIHELTTTRDIGNHEIIEKLEAILKEIKKRTS